MNKTKISLVFIILTFLTSCTSPHITNTGNACTIFAQGHSFFGDWYQQTKTASDKYKIDMPILLATIKAESSFRSTAFSKRQYLLGIIPWGHISSAFGYAQALDGTWRLYKLRTGNVAASRSSFGDAIDFIAWYHRTSAMKAGINPHNAYELYLSYHMGWSAFAKSGPQGASPKLRQLAHNVAIQANIYAQQLRSCGYM
ncbi:MAG: hypothetical protein QWI73_03660 [Alphaproteobacteria bacterium]|nr:hypothetical protein [Alphaproteobacteria bacterium]